MPPINIFAIKNCCVFGLGRLEKIEPKFRVDSASEETGDEDGASKSDASDERWFEKRRRKNPGLQKMILKRPEEPPQQLEPPEFGQPQENDGRPPSPRHPSFGKGENKAFPNKGTDEDDESPGEEEEGTEEEPHGSTSKLQYLFRLRVILN